MIASLSLAGLLGIIAVVTSPRDVAPARHDAVAAHSAKSTAAPERPRPFKYFRTGRLQADARTFVAVVRYLIEPEIQRNPSGGFPPPQLGAPTNIVSAPGLKSGIS